jgi:hypothetical protein
MPREASLFDVSKGSVVDAYFLLRKDGGKNIPPAWINRAKGSRKKRELSLGKALFANKLDAVTLLKDWEIAYQKECFYHGLRALLELERNKKTKY